MSTISNTYKINNVKQLIDLNGDIKNFMLKFEVQSTNPNDEFDILVVDQTTLDADSKIEYKHVAGYISGEILADKNVYQNYFLIIKSETPCECVVTINIKEILPNINNNVGIVEENFFVKYKVYILVVIIIFICGVLIYYYLIQNPKQVKQLDSGDSGDINKININDIIIDNKENKHIQDADIDIELRNILNNSPPIKLDKTDNVSIVHSESSSRSNKSEKSNHSSYSDRSRYSIKSDSRSDRYGPSEFRSSDNHSTHNTKLDNNIYNQLASIKI